MPFYEAGSFDNAKVLLNDQRVRKLRLHFDITCDEFFSLVTLAGEASGVTKIEDDFLILRAIGSDLKIT